MLKRGGCCPPPPPENSVEPQWIARAAPSVNTSVTTEVVQFFVSTVVCITRKQIATLRLRCRNTSQSSTGTQKTFILPPWMSNRGILVRPQSSVLMGGGVTPEITLFVFSWCKIDEVSTPILASGFEIVCTWTLKFRKTICCDNATFNHFCQWTDWVVVKNSHLLNETESYTFFPALSAAVIFLVTQRFSSSEHLFFGKIHCVTRLM